jgi:hypothetical protein
MKLERSLERLIKRYGPLEVLEALARIFLRWAERRGKAGKKSRTQPFKLQGFASSSVFYRYARALRRLVGELRHHDEPDSEPVGREKR